MAGFFRHQTANVILSYHGPVHLGGKRALHGNQMFPLNSQLLTGRDYGQAGKDSGKNPFFPGVQFGKGGKLLASCCDKNISRYFFCKERTASSKSLTHRTVPSP